MGRDNPKERGRGFPPGLSMIQEQLRYMREEGANLASRLLEEVSGALAEGQRAVGTLVDQAAELGEDIQQRVQSTGRGVEQQIERILSRFEAEAGLGLADAAADNR